MLVRILVRLSGGWWAHRERTVRAHGPLRRVHAAVHKLYLEEFGGYISLLTTFAGPPRFPHKPTGVFIAPGAVIGRDVTIYQQVTIGKNDIETSRWFGAPTIGDDVYIGAGAKILGPVWIGDDVQVGANAVVIHDVPAGAIAVGVPAQIRLRPLATPFDAEIDDPAIYI